MKPRTFTSVRDFLAPKSAETRANPGLPYDTYTGSKAGFLTLAVDDEFTALPLSTLAKASQLNDGKMILLEFGRVNVTIKGRGLEGLFEDILLCRVRVVRLGKHASCTVDEIRVTKAATL